MSNKSILSILDEVAAVSGKLDKIAILEANKDNNNLQRVFYLALNGLISFYIKKLPDAHVYRDELFLEEALDALDQLADRTYTGHAASDYVKNILESCSEDDAEVVRRVLGRDLRIGASEGSADKVWPGLIPSFAVMLATAYSDKALAKIKYPAYAQLKADGSRTQAIVDTKAKTVSFWTRNGKEVQLSKTKADEILAVFDGFTSKFHQFVIDGEIVCFDENGVVDRATGNGIYTKAVKGTISADEEAGLHFQLWDIIPFVEWTAGKSVDGYKFRLEQLKKLKHDKFTSVIETHVVNNLAEATAIYTKYIGEGLEGIILKNMNSLWEDKRSKDQVKFKQVLTADLEIEEIEPGAAGKKYAETAGAIRGKTSCGKLKVSVSGMTDDMRDWLWANRFELPGKIFEAEYNGIVKRRGSDEYSLFLPQFSQMRDDKTQANSLDELQEAKTEASL
jgi:ATP-dependent DNA ligase